LFTLLSGGVEVREIEWLKELFSFGFPFLRSVEYQRVLAKMQRLADEGNDDVACDSLSGFKRAVIFQKICDAVARKSAANN
jgi:hypothetical protein